MNESGILMYKHSATYTNNLKQTPESIELAHAKKNGKGVLTGKCWHRLIRLQTETVCWASSGTIRVEGKERNTQFDKRRMFQDLRVPEVGKTHKKKSHSTIMQIIVSGLWLSS